MNRFSNFFQMGVTVVIAVAAIVLVAIILALVDTIAAYLFSKITPFSLFQASIICGIMGVVLTVVFCAAAVADSIRGENDDVFIRAIKPSDIIPRSIPLRSRKMRKQNRHTSF